ncbi:MAG: FtsX-like permease family protein [Betaproteobacteria bacterium]|nr:MAG: FtsX-like permease family protein [Betaproteobacteria bacterium]
MKTRNRMIVRDMWHLRGQLIATALVVMCGVASFVSMRCTYDSLRIAQAEYYQGYRFANVFAQLKRAPLSLTRQIEEIEGVAGVRARVVMGVTLDVPGLDEPASGRLVAVPERRAPMINDLYLTHGRYVEPERPDEVIASKAFATANNLELGDTLGAVINGRWQQLTIVGIGLSPEYIYEAGGGTIFPDNRRFGVLWMGETALAAAFNMEGAFNDVALTLSAGAMEAEVITRLDDVLARYGGLGAYDREEQLSHRFISDEIAQNRISSTYLPAIFLGVAAFLLHIVLSRLVALQRTEIGLLKAFGYSNFDVGMHYFKLAVITVLSGVAIGAAGGLYLGAQLTTLYQEYYRFPTLPFAVTPEVIAIGVAVSLAAATAGALSAVRRAAVLPPAVAMRPEPPASYHATVLERSGLYRILPASARMIGRHLLRRRWHSFMSTFGIACAAGILLVGGFLLASISHLMHMQFEEVQREDVLIVFNEPASASARLEVGRLPGVLYAEPFRSVPVRFRSAHRTKRAEIIGIQQGSRLRRLVDAEARTVDLPPDGLVLSRKLAELLDVRAGDTLQVEVLEGARPVRPIQISRLVDELIGLGAYMEISALNRVMREGPSISGAYLAIDDEHAGNLYTTLKNLPAVGGVAFREALLESFQEILDRSVVTATMINIVFACIIAFGVVYNGARIALSERGNELASLRVLGFTRREVSAILLGEQAVLTLAAIPLGFSIGVVLSWLLSLQLDTEFYRMPLLFTSSTFGLSLVVVLIAAAVSGALVARRLNELDLIAVLKTRE